MSENKNNNTPQRGKGGGNEPKMPPVPKFKLSWLYMIIGVTLIILWWNGKDGSGMIKEVTYDPQFKQYISEGYASRVVVYDDRTLNMYLKPTCVKEVYGPDAVKMGPHPYVTVQYGSEESLEQFLEKEKTEGRFDGSIEYDKHEDYWGAILGSLLPIVFLVAIWIFIMPTLLVGKTFLSLIEIL